MRTPRHRALRTRRAGQTGQGTIEYVLIIGVIAVVLMNLLMVGKFLLDRVVEERIEASLGSWNQETADYEDDGHHEGKLPPCGHPLSPPACEP